MNGTSFLRDRSVSFIEQTGIEFLHRENERLESVRITSGVKLLFGMIEVCSKRSDWPMNRNLPNHPQLDLMVLSRAMLIEETD